MDKIRFICPKCHYAEDIIVPSDVDEVECPRCHNMMRRSRK